MILQSLNELYSRLAGDPAYEIPPPGFSPQKISFRVVIRADGTLFSIEDARVPDSKGIRRNSIMIVPGEAKYSGSSINPGLLWDNQTYLLGRSPHDKPAEFGIERFEAFRRLHLDLESTFHDPDFSAVCRFLEHWSPERIADYPILEEVGTGFGIFILHGESRPVHESMRVQEWCRRTFDEASEGDSQSQCLLTGTIGPVVRLHPKIKGVTGAQPVGASIVSFNATAYESYGKSQSFNAPVSKEAAFRYGAALNSLLNGPLARKHRLRIGDATTVFWTERPTLVEDLLADLLSGGFEGIDENRGPLRRTQFQQLCEAIRTGKHHGEQAELRTPFSILGLAPNGGRVSVRFFHRSTVADLVSKLHAHYDCLRLVRHFPKPVGTRSGESEFPMVWQILMETARTADEIPPLLGGALLRSIVAGSCYPEGLFSAIIRRIHADRTVNYIRAATLKAVLVRNHRFALSAMLDTSITEPAYLLGRLFSVLEKTQEDALGNIIGGIRDRFYSPASAAPATTFPWLLRHYQHHLPKLIGGAKIGRERLVQEILSSIDPTGFPDRFSLKQQGIFAIGYYHQRKSFFTKRDSPDDLTESP